MTKTKQIILTILTVSLMTSCDKSTTNTKENSHLDSMAIIESTQQLDSIKPQTYNLNSYGIGSGLKSRPINLCEDYYSIGSLDLPFSSGNFGNKNFYTGKIDEKSLAEIQKAHFISIIGINNSKCQFDDLNDSLLFKEDFNTFSNEEFMITKIGNNKVNYQTYLIFATNSNNLYLLTSQLLNQKKDCISIEDAALIASYVGGVYRGRHAIFHTGNKIEITDVCIVHDGQDQIIKYIATINEIGRIKIVRT